MNKILIIDDDTDKRTEIKDALILEMKGVDVSIVEIDEESSKDLLVEGDKENEDNSAEKCLERYLTSNPDVKLIVVDHDLSGYNSPLSESVISDACKITGVPHCRYSRVVSKQTERQKIKELVQRTHLYSAKLNLKGTGNIDIEGIPEDITRIHSIYLGFQRLEQEVFQLKECDFKGDNDKQLDIVDIASRILGKPNMKPSLSGYARSFNLYGDYVELREAIGTLDLEQEHASSMFKRNLTYLIGFWLYNSVLKFPGVILKSEAAAAYLNLNIDDFLENRDIFDTAIYDGPFSEKVPYDFWWRTDLDDILIEADVESGLELLLQLDKKCSHSECMVCGESAEFFCLVNEKPICKKHSKGSLEWMPRGADLSRIAEEAYELYHPHLKS